MKNLITVIIAVMLFSSCSSPYIHVMDIETGHTYAVKDVHSLTKVKDTLVTVLNRTGNYTYYGKYIKDLPSKYKKVVRIR